MSAIEFGLMLQPFPLHFAGIELYEYNRCLIRSLSPGFTTLWVEDHLQLGEIATHECMTTLRFHALGVTHFMFRFLDPESLERFVESVVPHFA